MELDLGNGRIALIDDEDWFAVKCNYRRDGTVDRVCPCELSWYYHETSGAVQSCYRRNGKKSGYSLKLHRLVSQCPAEMFANHANGNTLDNRKSNLRVCELKNCLSSRKVTRGKSAPYKGVSRDRRRSRYKAQIRVNGIQNTIGYCDTALETALMYDDAARVHFGEFARLNFPERKHGQKICLHNGIRNGANSITRKRMVVPNFNGKGHTRIDLGGFHAVIDDADWNAKKKHYWNDGSFVEIAPCDVVWNTHKNRRGVRYVQSNSMSRRINIHRLITECPPGFVVDHIDGNPLNNTQANLRICTNEQNLRNGRKRKRTKHQFKGVARLGYAKYAKPRYSFTIACDNTVYRGGKYQTKLQAALAYDDMAIKLHGEFACLNFPERHRAKMAIAN
jgi:hypothetical protein